MAGSWLELHKSSELLAAQAEVASRNGARAEAVELYFEAAAAESAALDQLDHSKQRTMGISAVSAASLYYKAGRLDLAETLALRWMSSGLLFPYAATELRGLVQSIWSEQIRARAKLNFAPGQVVVSVKGGDIVEGGAPLDLIVDRVQIVQSLFYRTAELLRGLPHRTRGPAPRSIQESCRPWLFQTAPGSYQFAVAIQEPKQQDLFGSPHPPSQDVANLFLRILRAGVESPDKQLVELVPASDYRGTFLKLTRSLAPSGKTFDALEVRASDDSLAVRLQPETRIAVNAVLRQEFPTIGTVVERTKLSGILRAVHLDRDWIEVTIEGEHVRIVQVSEAVDDVIGPMVNKLVTVEVEIDSTGQHRFLDIEPAD